MQYKCASPRYRLPARVLMNVLWLGFGSVYCPYDVCEHPGLTCYLYLLSLSLSSSFQMKSFIKAHKGTARILDVEAGRVFAFKEYHFNM